MSVITQGWGDPFAPLTGGYGAGAAGRLASASAEPSRLSEAWWWQSVAGWLPWPALVAPAPALWWSWWWAAPPAVPAHAYRAQRGLFWGAYHYQSSGGGPMGASPLGATPHTVTLRTHDKFVPFALNFAPDVAPSDEIVAASVTITQQPVGGLVPVAADVTSALLMGQSTSGTSVSVVLANANAVRGMAYQIHVIAVMASGLVLEETIGDGHPSKVICDE